MGSCGRDRSRQLVAAVPSSGSGKPHRHLHPLCFSTDRHLPSSSLVSSHLIPRHHHQNNPIRLTFKSVCRPWSFMREENRNKSFSTSRGELIGLCGVEIYVDGVFFQVIAFRVRLKSVLYSYKIDKIYFIMKIFSHYNKAKVILSFSFFWRLDLCLL